MHGFQKSLHPCASDESSLSIGRVENSQILQVLPVVYFEASVACRYVTDEANISHRLSCYSINLLILTTAKGGLAILMKSCRQKHF